MATKRAEPLSKRRGDSQRHSLAALPSHSPSISDTPVLSIVTAAPRGFSSLPINGDAQQEFALPSLCEMRRHSLGRRCLPEQARHQVAKSKIGLDMCNPRSGPRRGMISGVFKLAEFARLGSKLAPIFPAVGIGRNAVWFAHFTSLPIVL